MSIYTVSIKLELRRIDWCKTRTRVSKHRHAKRARVIFFRDRSIRRVVYSNNLVKFFWVAMCSKKETGNL